MKLLDRIVGKPQARVGWPGNVPETWLWGSFFSAASSAGPTVTVEGSLRLDAVWACVRVLAESGGALPLKTYQRIAGTGGRGRREAFYDPTYRLLHDEPNAAMTAVDLWSMALAHCNTWGNAYLGKNFVPDSMSPTGQRVSELWPLGPQYVTVSRPNGRKVFTVRDPFTGDQTDFGSDRIIHIRGLSLDGLTGLSPISVARHAIGRGLAEDDFGGAFFRNFAMPRGVLQLDGELSEERTAKLRAQWKALYGGNNVNSVAVLENGMSFQPITMPLEDAQFVEQQKLTTQRIARIFRVPASMIGAESGDSLTYKTVEGDALHFERYSLRPWLVRFEQALARDRDLFPGDGRGMYPQFVTDAILRADTKTRYESYALALDPATGWMTREEVRGLEDLPPEQAPTPAPPSLAGAEALFVRHNQRVAAQAQAERQALARAGVHTNGGGHRVHA